MKDKESKVSREEMDGDDDSWRPEGFVRKARDMQPGDGEIYKLFPQTGET